MATDSYIGEIMLFAGNFAPKGYALCNGQILNIQQNSALFAILGTTYGGNGTTTFALPDLRGRVPLHFGQGAGLSNYYLGEQIGEENHTLLTNEMPMHNHSANANNNGGDSTTPLGMVPSTDGSGTTTFYAASSNAIMNPSSIGIAGGSAPHNNMQPYLTINYCICLLGSFPPHN